MTADWTETPHLWQNPHERTYYREPHPPRPAGSVAYPNTFTGLSPETRDKERRLQDSLDKVLGPEYVQTRPGGGGAKLTYLEGWRAINLANEVFGYNGWYTDIKYLEVDFCELNPESGRYSMGVTAIVRVRLPDGASHEDIGYGKLENTKSKGDGLDKCKKEAVTDGLKRALRHFGKLLGNCLYDKHYLTQLSAMKASKPKFDWDTLYKPEHHSLHATLPKPIPARPVVPPCAIDPASLPPPPPHPPHMTSGSTAGAPTTTTTATNNKLQRAQTVGSGVDGSKPSNVTANGTAKPPPLDSNSHTVQPQNRANAPRPAHRVESGVAPQRSATVSYSAGSSMTAARVVPAASTSRATVDADFSRMAAERVASAAATTTSSTSRGGEGGEYGIGSDDDSFFNAAMDVVEDQTGRPVDDGEEIEDSGFVEATLLSNDDTHAKPNARPHPRSNAPSIDPLPANNRPNGRATSNPNPDASVLPPPNLGSVAEQNRLAAIARRDQKAKERAAQLEQQKQQESHENPRRVSGGETKSCHIPTTTTTTAAQLVRTNHQHQLRPPVPPPARTTSVHPRAAPPAHPAASTTTSKPVNPNPGPRQAGILPPLHVGNSIVQAEAQQQQQQQQQQYHQVAPASVAVTSQGGFISAKGVKRKSEETSQEGRGGGGGGGPPCRAQTISTSNPATASRQPLGELDVSDSGSVKRYRASS
ncbi:hypothetical protein JCM3766R1_001258 [Sporobolomyces carnicolor]